jgi:hypothetical protein
MSGLSTQKGEESHEKFVCVDDGFQGSCDLTRSFGRSACI